ncbi:MAG: hypothetical protein R3Y22_09480 [Bacteroidales bacterium]
MTYIVTGNIVSDVDVYENDSIVARTDIDGRFSLLTTMNSNLLFRHPDYDDVVVAVDGRQQLAVSMRERSVSLEEIVVVAQKANDNIGVEPTDIEIKGDYFHLKTRFRVPRKLFKSDYRFIVQPTIYNITRDKRYLLRPVVIDGKNYAVVQHRYLGYDNNNDKLNDYIIAINKDRTDDIYTYGDSLYIEPKYRDDDYKSDCYLVLASYRPPYKYQDSITIAKGVQNNLRFFEYELSPMKLGGDIVEVEDADSLTMEVMSDSTLAPAPELKLRSSDGVVNISFIVNSVNIDYSNQDNFNNIKQITDLLDDIQGDANSTLSAISIIGYASPEGSYEYNKKIADGRTRELMSKITESVNPTLLNHIELTSNGVVNQWSDLVDIIEPEDSLLRIKVQSIIKKYKNNLPSIQYAIRKLPEYRGLIINKYLPRLRRVEYTINYTSFKEIPIDEIKDKYNADSSSLSAYEYYKYIRNEQNIETAIKIEQSAIAKYPTFSWALNRTAIRSIVGKESELSLLKPIVKDNAPLAIKYNQLLTAIDNRSFHDADSLARTIKDNSLYVERARSVIDAFNGDYKDALATFGKEGSLNQVILLLALGENKTAYAKMKKYMQDLPRQEVAKNWYIFAIAANRNDDLSAAIAYLQMAVDLDSSMLELAKIDTDLLDILELIISDEQQDEELYE